MKVSLTDAVPVTEDLPGNYRNGRIPGRHYWDPGLRDVRTGETAACGCGLRIRRLKANGRHFEALNGEYPSKCPL